MRVFLVHHVTFSINSICHFFGRRRFDTDDQSTNVFWLALPSFGEAWHHNHHAFPRSALHGLRWWELDPGGWVIRSMERLGLAWNVVLITKERQRQKVSDAAQAAARLPAAPAFNCGSNETRGVRGLRGALPAAPVHPAVAACWRARGAP